MSEWSLPQSCLTPNPYSQPLLRHQCLLSTYYAAGSGLGMKAIKMGQTGPHPCAESPQSSENTEFTCNPHNQLRSCGHGTGYEEGVTMLCGRYQGRAVPPQCPASTPDPSPPPTPSPRPTRSGVLLWRWLYPMEPNWLPPVSLRARPPGDLARPAQGRRAPVSCGFPESTEDASPLMLRGSDKPLND